MRTFTPPTQPDMLFGGGEAAHPLWGHYGALEAGVTVWRGPDGIYRQTQYPYQGGAEYRTYNDTDTTTTTDDPNTGLATATEVYMGGAATEITQQQADDLIALQNPDYHKGLRLESIDESFTKPNGPLVDTFGPDLYWERIVQEDATNAMVVDNQLNLTIDNQNTDNYMIMWPNLSSPNITGSILINEMTGTSGQLPEAAVGPAFRTEFIKYPDVVHTYSCELWKIGATTTLFIGKYKFFGESPGYPGVSLKFLAVQNIDTASMSYPDTLVFTADGPDLSGSIGPLSVAAVDHEFKTGLVSCGFAGNGIGGSPSVIRCDNFHAEVL